MPGTGAPAAGRHDVPVPPPEEAEPRRSASSTAGLARASHPEPAVTVTALATALAATSGRGPTGCALVAAAVLTGQLSVGWSNDWIDRARDAAADRRDKPLVAGASRPRAVAVAAGWALGLCVPLSLASGPAAGAAHLTCVAAAWAYNLGVKRTVLSWLPYAVAFGLLPAFVTLGLPGRPWPPVWAVTAGALLGVGAHLTNVLPDIDADLAAGVRGLPQRLGRCRTRYLAPVPLFAASTVLVFGPPERSAISNTATLTVTGALAVTTALLPDKGPRGRIPFLTTLALAVTAVSLLLVRGRALV
ncbi:UbiA family prenyltransferase [Streptomyces macrolidinus]|uniref:UbiA family prenyltransferase n=1 Tax=Streptomyces macrolidinus TaxID=2952607 RepID=UPI0027E273F2|nr:UbiA family prenyltransferase [Streptomyces macrolidinus]